MITATYDTSCFTRVVICFVLIVFTTGCTTMRPLSAIDAQSLARQIDVGDKIKIMRNDGTDITFKVSAVSDEGISGDEVFIAYSDIRQVEVSLHSPVKTYGFLAVGALVLLYIFRYEALELAIRSGQ